MDKEVGPDLPMETILLLANSERRWLPRQASARSPQRGQSPDRRHSRLEAGRRAWWAKPSSPPPTGSRPAVPRRSWASQGADFAPSRYATDAAAAEALAKAAQATIILAPATSRWNRVLPGVAQRLGGRADTHVTGLSASGGKLSVSRWYYRQRMEAVLQRTQRPWFILVDPGSQPAWQGGRRHGHRPNRRRDPAGDLQAHHGCRRARARRRRADHPARRRFAALSPAPVGPRNRPTASRM